MWLSRVAAFLRRLTSSRTAERALNDDVESYAELMADELAASGVSLEEARRRARAEMGGVESVKESVREVRSGAWVEQTWRDVVQAVRGLRRTPGFAVTAILTIGLGIGVNTAIFTVINSALLKPVPYERPQELLDLGHYVTSGPAQGRTFSGLNWIEIDQWRKQPAIFQGVEAFRSPTSRQWLERDEPLLVGAMTAGLPRLLGIAPQRGRIFSAEEAAVGADVIVIADGLWNRVFDGRSGAIGEAITIDGRRMTVIGVMPPTFRYGPGGAGRVMAWIPLPERSVPGVSGSSGASPIFRLRTELTLETAQPLANAVAERMQRHTPSEEPWRPEFMPLLQSRQSAGTRFGSAMFYLLAAAGLVLLVACANVANLLLSRGTSRHEELAMRSALGASRARLVRLLLGEGFAVAAIGGLTAIGLAQWSLGAVTALIPPRLASGLFSVGIPEFDWRVLIFALAITTLVALLSAIWPALSATRTSLRLSAGHGRQTAGLTRERRRVSRGLQAAQVALALVLAIAGGLFASSFVRLVSTDLGFDTNGLGTVLYSLPSSRYPSNESKRTAIAAILSRVRTTPGVGSAAMGFSPGSKASGRFIVTGMPVDAGLNSSIRDVGDGYFETSGIRIVAGRPINRDDLARAALVAVVDERDARRVFGDQSPIGRRFTYSPYIGEVEIVGLASHVETADMGKDANQIGTYIAAPLSTNLVVRADGDLTTVLKNVRASIAALDPAIRVLSTGAATDVYDVMETFSAPRFYVVVVSLFGVLALVTAGVGLYGLLAHGVGQRRREIGVRVALGSTPAQIRALVLKDAVGPVLIGVLFGAVASWWVAGLLESFLYGIGPRNPIAFAIGALALILSAGIATIVPVRRATGVDPIVALRAE